jgi:hypothetical protein
MYEDARWFEQLGTCRCGKPATGRLNNSRNETLCRCCNKCAAKFLKEADAARAKAAKLRPTEE